MNKISLGLSESEVLQKVSSFILANLLWILFAIPIITIPAATAGLFATFGPWMRGKSASVFPDFFEGMKHYWVKAVLVTAIDVVIGGLSGLNLLIISSTEMPPFLAMLSLSVTLGIALFTIMVNIYLWPSMVLFELPFRRLVIYSMALATRHPWWSLLLVAIIMLIVGASAVVPQFFLLLVTFSGCALVMCWGQWRVARQHIEADELARLEAPRE